MIACVVGAGFSHPSGVPLAARLFDSRDLIAVSPSAERRLLAVAHAYAAWRERYQEYHPELFVQYVYKSRTPPVLFQWVAEWIAVAVASPQTTSAAANPRYLNAVRSPLGIPSYTRFWMLLVDHSTELAVVSFNYDLVVERSLRHRPMQRPPLPGFFYGGIPEPQRMHGSPVAPWNRHADSDPISGKVALCKLHGSVNWSLTRSGVRIWHDARPCFRAGGDAAIIPPLPRKQLADWLHPIWDRAAAELARAKCWVVCGYSLPDYDLAAIALFKAAGQGCERILVLDPSAQTLARWRAVAPDATVTPLAGFPSGLDKLTLELGGLCCGGSD